jgi:hypothetical protein
LFTGRDSQQPAAWHRRWKEHLGGPAFHWLAYQSFEATGSGFGCLTRVKWTSELLTKKRHGIKKFFFLQKGVLTSVLSACEIICLELLPPMNLSLSLHQRLRLVPLVLSNAINQREVFVSITFDFCIFATLDLHQNAFFLRILRAVV